MLTRVFQQSLGTTFCTNMITFAPMDSKHNYALSDSRLIYIMQSPHHVPFFYPVPLPHRSRPAEYNPGLGGWYQDGRRVQNVKPSRVFIWPKDGRNGSSWGRIKDILQNKGPDIHIAISASKNDHMHNRQRRPRWSGHTRLDSRGPDSSISSACAPWTRNAGLGGRTPGLSYDFRTRRYIRPDPDMWTDAKWQAEPNAQHVYPEAVRDDCGVWWQDNYYSPVWMGGRPRPC
jgi:hypothetical protein